jgi:hypothetical protein
MYKLSDALARQFAGHEIITASLTSEAFERIGSRVPDLVIFPLSLFPTERDALVARLQEWSAAQPGGASPLSLPSASAPGAPQWFYWFRSHDARAIVSGSPAKTDEAAPPPCEEPLPPADVRPAAPAAPPLAAMHAVETPAPPQPAPAITREPIVEPSASVVESTEPILETKSDPAPLPSATPPIEPVASPVADVMPVPPAPKRRTPKPPRPSRLPAIGRAARHGMTRLRTSAITAARRTWALALAIAARVAAVLAASGRGVWRVLHTLLLALSRGTRAAARAGSAMARAAWAAMKRLGPRIAALAGRLRLSPAARRIAVRTAGAGLAAAAALVVAVLIVRQVGAVTTAMAERRAAAPKAEEHPVAPPAATTGRLTVRSQPSGVPVILDGQNRGVTPLLVENLKPGEHTVLLEQDGGIVQQPVRIKANEMATLDVPLFTGWVALFAPFEVQITDGGRLVTLDEQNHALLAAGAHNLQIVNKTLGFRTTQHVVIRSGEVTAASIVPPTTPATMTSTPAAEVWIDGTRVGETPIEGLGVAIGTREIVFRNAELGERHVTTTVTTRPFRLDMDFSKSQ